MQAATHTGGSGTKGVGIVLQAECGAPTDPPHTHTHAPHPQVRAPAAPPPTLRTHRCEYLLNTGNLQSRSGLDLSQATGFTVVAEKLNFYRCVCVCGWGGGGVGGSSSGAAALGSGQVVHGCTVAVAVGSGALGLAWTGGGGGAQLPLVGGVVPCMHACMQGQGGEVGGWGLVHA